MKDKNRISIFCLSFLIVFLSFNSTICFAQISRKDLVIRFAWEVSGLKEQLNELKKLQSKSANFNTSSAWSTNEVSKLDRKIEEILSFRSDLIVPQENIYLKLANHQNNYLLSQRKPAKNNPMVKHAIEEENFCKEETIENGEVDDKTEDGIRLLGELKNELNFSGFFDVTKKINTNGTDEEMNYGQFELDLSKNVTNMIDIEGAIAYDSEDGKFEIGIGYVDFHLNKDDSSKSVGTGFLTNLGIIIGQFDVPFGIDYMYIASPDRKLITPPLANQKTIDGLNNFGVVFYGGSERFIFNLFCINGYSDEAIAIGGRISVKLFENLEIGTSYLGDFVRPDQVHSNVRGLDLQYSHSTVELKGEFIKANGIIDGELNELGANNTHQGYYLQILNNFDGLLDMPVFGSLRYGRWNDVNNESQISRVTVGLGYSFSNEIEARAEYLTQLNNNGLRENFLSLQLVVSY